MKYWIIQGRDFIRKIYRSCVVCARYSHRSFSPLMGNLPSERVNISKPFNYTGVDFFGPYFVHYRLSRGSRPLKMYALVFVCFSTKACHFEVCNDLKTETFLQALKRFIARRGTPSKIFSDNGTTFSAASKVVKQDLSSIKKNISSFESVKYYSENGIEWSFIPPYAPNQGGLWEAAVKSAKFHLKRVIGGQILTILEFQTLLCQIEAILNSRPLTTDTSSSEELEYLTPGHFLIIQPLVDTSVALESPTVKLNTRFQLKMQMYRQFWIAWSKEYLQTLQLRPKCRNQEINIRLGQIVLIQEKNIPPTKWILGKVIRLYTGSDNTVRVVSLKTKNGIVNRSVLKLASLPIGI